MSTAGDIWREESRVKDPRGDENGEVRISCISVNNHQLVK